MLQATVGNPNYMGRVMDEKPRAIRKPTMVEISPEPADAADVTEKPNFKNACQILSTFVDNCLDAIPHPQPTPKTLTMIRESVERSGARPRVGVKPGAGMAP